METREKNLNVKKDSFVLSSIALNLKIIWQTIVANTHKIERK